MLPELDYLGLPEGLSSKKLLSPDFRTIVSHGKRKQVFCMNLKGTIKGSAISESHI